MLRSLITFFLLATNASAFAPATGFGSPVRQQTSLAAGEGEADSKVVLVTGSSRGLGKAIALEIGKSGSKVVINYVSDGSKEAADATCKEIEALGGEAFAIQADSKYC